MSIYKMVNNSQKLMHDMPFKTIPLKHSAMAFPVQFPVNQTQLYSATFTTALYGVDQKANNRVLGQSLMMQKYLL